MNFFSRVMKLCKSESSFVRPVCCDEYRQRSLKFVSEVRHSYGTNWKVEYEYSKDCIYNSQGKLPKREVYEQMRYIFFEH